MATGLVVKFKVLPGKNAQFEAAFAQMQADMRVNEPGAIYYDLYLSDDPQIYVMLERYADEAAFAAHSKTKHMERVLAGLAGTFEGRPEAVLLNRVSTLK